MPFTVQTKRKWLLCVHAWMAVYGSLSWIYVKSTLIIILKQTLRAASLAQAEYAPAKNGGITAITVILLAFRNTRKSVEELFTSSRICPCGLQLCKSSSQHIDARKWVQICKRSICYSVSVLVNWRTTDWNSENQYFSQKFGQCLNLGNQTLT